MRFIPLNGHVHMSPLLVLSAWKLVQRVTSCSLDGPVAIYTWRVVVRVVQTLQNALGMVGNYYSLANLEEEKN